MSTTAVNPTESAPVTEVVETQEVSLQQRLNEATPEEYSHWEKTGDIPAIKPPKEVAAPEPAKKETKSEISEPKTEISAPSTKADSASPATAQKPHRGKTKEDTARRFQELLEDNKGLKHRLEEIERKSAPAVSETPASQPEKKAEGRAEPKLDDKDAATGKPKYDSLEAYLADVRKWDREQILAEVDGRTSKAEQIRAQAEHGRAIAEQQKILGEGLNAKFNKTREKYADFDEVALNKDLVIPAGSIVDVFLLDSEHAGEVAYYLGRHPEVLDSFYSDYDLKTGKFTNKINPMRQHRQLLEIERQLTSAPVAVSKSASAPSKPLPPPPTVLSAKSSAEGDPMEEAIRKKSFADYEKAANASERKARRA